MVLTEAWASAAPSWTLGLSSARRRSPRTSPTSKSSQSGPFVGPVGWPCCLEFLLRSCQPGGVPIFRWENLEGKASAREFSVLHHFSVTHNHDSKRLGRSCCFLLSDTKPLASHNIVNVSPDRQKISGAIATASRLPALIDQYNRGRRAMWVLRSVQIVQSFFCMPWCIYSVSFCLPPSIQ